MVDAVEAQTQTAPQAIARELVSAFVLPEVERRRLQRTGNAFAFAFFLPLQPTHSRSVGWSLPSLGAEDVSHRRFVYAAHHAMLQAVRQAFFAANSARSTAAGASQPQQPNAAGHNNTSFSTPTKPATAASSLTVSPASVQGSPAATAESPALAALAEASP